jgi:hypothetical protein
LCPLDRSYPRFNRHLTTGMLRGIFFGFEDVAMECGYQRYRLSKLFDNLRQTVLYLWIPVASLKKISVYAYCSVYSINLTEIESLHLRIRIALLIVAICLFLKNWDSSIKHKIGVCLPWMNRVHHIILANEQANIVTDDLYSITTLISLLNISGLETSTYAEFFSGSLFVICIRPIRLLLRSSDPKMYDLFWQVSYLHGLLFISGAVMAWKFQSESRRQWLLLPNSTSLAATTDKSKHQKHRHETDQESAEQAAIIAKVKTIPSCNAIPSIPISIASVPGKALNNIAPFYPARLPLPSPIMTMPPFGALPPQHMRTS